VRHLSRTNRLLEGLSFGYLQQILVMAAGLWLTPFFLGRLGQHDLGMWLILTQITLYLGLLDLGVVALLPRETAFAVGRGGIRSGELPRLIGQTARMVMLQWPVVAICAGVVWFLGRAMWRSAEFPLGMILLAFAAMFPFRIFAAVLQGLQDLAFLARSQIAVWVVSTAATVILLLNGYGLMALAISWVINQLANTALCFYRLKRQFPSVLPGQLSRLDRPAALAYFKKSAWISTSQIGHILRNGTDMLLIGRFLGPTATVPYSCTGKLVSVLANQPQMVMQAAFPGLSQLKAAESRARIRQATVALSQAMLAASGAVACVVLAVNRSFVNFWIGPAQYGGGLLSLLIVVTMLARHWNLTFYYSLFCFGYERRLALIGVVDGCVSIAASMILLPLVGPIGAPIGILIGTCLVSIPASVIPLAREMEISPAGLLGCSSSWLLRFVLASAIGASMAAVWNPQGFVSMAALAIVTGILYLGLVMPVLVQEPLGSYIRPKLRFLPAHFHRIFPSLVDQKS